MWWRLSHLHDKQDHVQRFLAMLLADRSVAALFADRDRLGYVDSAGAG
jgi:hypothetical protein